MKGLELDILALVLKQVHDQLQVRLVRDVPRHHVEVGTIEEDLAKKLQRLALGNVVRGVNES
jgi:hypothetical protein